MTADDLRARIDGLIQEFGESYSSISRLLGRNETYIQQYLRRKSPRILEMRDRRILASHFGVDPETLGIPKATRYEATSDLEVSELAAGFSHIRSYDLSASAGPGTFVDHERTGQNLSFETKWLRQITSAPADQLAVIQVDGDSMAPTLMNGDRILVDSGVTNCGADGIYVIRIQDVLQVKRISINPTQKTVTIRSDNPAYESWPDCPVDDIDVVGRVLWVGRKL